MTASSPKILLLDIETVPLESWTWGLWDQNVGLDQIKTEWSIISFAAKWFGKREVIYHDTKGDVRNDWKLLGEIWKLLDAADIVVAQNGRRFDVKKINARLIMSGYGPYSPVRIVDTLLVAKKHFAFTSNKLAWTSKYLTDAPKSEHKKFPGFELWAEVMKDNPKAWAEMKKYNIQDIRSLEKLYKKLLPWIDNHPNVGAYNFKATPSCPKCGSAKMQQRGFAVLQQGKYARYQCQSCAGWSRGKVMLLDKDKRKSMLA
jgi:hypothetical protein